MLEASGASRLSLSELRLLVSESVLSQAITAEAIGFRIDPAFAAAGFLERYNIRGEQAANSLVFAAGKEENRKYSLLLTPAHSRLSSREIKSALGSGKWSMASPEETLALTGSPLGSVGPFGWPPPWPWYIASDFFQHLSIVVGGSMPEVKFVVDPHRLKEFGAQPFDRDSRGR
jgi:prolyl-tRNA editing enzyme YbaK/EbsC (Cys-tRNA(Pro) deacylase)